MIPTGAKHEATLSGGVVLYDASHLLPKHRVKRYATRDVAGIVRLYAHHSGADGAPGVAGLLGSARYATTDPRRDAAGKIVKGTGGGFAGFSYTVWFSYEPDRDADGAIVVYRGNRDETRSAHTGGDANGHGSAVCFQGNLTNKPPSDAQIEMAEAFYPWWLAQRPRLDASTALSFHSESAQYGGSGKKACPGPHVERWVTDYREAA